MTTNNERYLDFLAGIAVNALGHRHPHLVEALKTQADKVWHLSNVFRVPGGERLAKRLVEHSFADQVFFSNSGTEAVECGLKMIRRYHFDLQGDGQPAQRHRIIGVTQSFHGRTYGAICAAGNPAYVKGFTRGDQGYDQVPFNDIAAMEAAITEQTAGIIIEPIQGEGGVCAASLDYLKRVRELCDEHGILLMFDEVQCGVGRTGSLFAYEQFGVEPDIMALAKALGCGFPLGACLATEAVAKSMVVGTHGSTFGGNPLATAVGNAVMDIIATPEFLAQVRANGELLRAELLNLQKQFPNLIDDVRGMGLMQGARCTNIESATVLNKCRERKLLIGKAGDNTIRLLPPLIIDPEHIAEAMAVLHQVFSELNAAL